ncbi:MAG: DcaP family trimeric outer membrane transporter [Methylomonas sp.]|nr:DcaP family trimeric outer membrane transporter [Methylomonas sp.]
MHLNRIVLVLLPVLIAMSFSVSAEEDLRTLIKAMSARMTELGDQVKQSNQRIAELEAKLAQIQQEKNSVAAAAASSQPPPPISAATGTATTPTAEGQTKDAQPVVVGDTKGTFKIPGTDTSLGFGGYVKLDANYSNVSMGRDKLGDQHLLVAQIPVGDERLGLHSKTTFHAKESRFWLKSFTPSSWGDINTLLEVDFLNAPETFNYTPRLRHAYGSIGNFLAGQTWTTFLNVAAIADTQDAAGPVGALVYQRQPQLRWTQPFNLAGTPMEFQTALESPRSRLWVDPALAETADGYGFNYPNGERYPDLIARLNYNPDWGSLSLAAMARQIRYTKPASTQEAGDWGGAVSLAGKINTLGMDNLRFMLNYGNALGRYASINLFEDAALDADGRLQLVKAYGGTLAYQHWWNNSWRSTLAYGIARADQPAFVFGARTTRQAQSVHANLLWSPTLQTTFGLEYIYAERERVDELSGDLHRLQFSTRFNF